MRGGEGGDVPSFSSGREKPTERKGASQLKTSLLRGEACTSATTLPSPNAAGAGGGCHGLCIVGVDPAIDHRGVLVLREALDKRLLSNLKRLRYMMEGKQGRRVSAGEGAGVLAAVEYLCSSSAWTQARHRG
jgi:hypothetical protein